MSEKERDEKLAIEDLDEAAGGWNISEKSLYKYELARPIYCCPKCMSKNVKNYDPGDIFEMRVKCNDCGYYGERGSISETKIQFQNPNY